MNKIPILKGQIDLALLAGTEVKTVDGKESLVIPIEINPFLILRRDKNGTTKAFLPVSVFENDPNPFNSHYLRISPDKAEVKGLGLTPKDLEKYAPVIGNLKKILDKKGSLTEINKIVSKLEDEDFDLADDDITGQVDGLAVVANIILDEPAGKKHTLLIEVNVEGKSYDHSETDGPHGRTLYCERGFNCTRVSPKALKIDNVEVPLSSKKLKKVLQDILDDVDAKEGFCGSEMY